MRCLCQTNVFTLHDESLMIGANDFIFIGLKNLVDSFTNFRGKLRDQNIKVLLLAVTSFRHKQPYYAEKVRRCHNHGKRQFWFYKQFRVLREAAKKKRFFWDIFPKSVFPPTHPRVFVRFGKTKGEIWVEKGDFRGNLGGV